VAIQSKGGTNVGGAASMGLGRRKFVFLERQSASKKNKEKIQPFGNEFERMSTMFIASGERAVRKEGKAGQQIKREHMAQKRGPTELKTQVKIRPGLD